jgi:hypothetical protein
LTLPVIRIVLFLLAVTRVASVDKKKGRDCAAFPFRRQARPAST